MSIDLIRLAVELGVIVFGAGALYNGFRYTGEAIKDLRNTLREIANELKLHGERLAVLEAKYDAQG